MLSSAMRACLILRLAEYNIYANLVENIATLPCLAASTGRWTVTRGVCRDDNGEYPRWGSAVGVGLEVMQQTCSTDLYCQGVAFARAEEMYGQYFGSDQPNASSAPGVAITRGSPTHPEYDCYIKNSTFAPASVMEPAADVTPLPMAVYTKSGGVCRDDNGDYPRWGSAVGVSLEVMQQTCSANLNCQGVAYWRTRTCRFLANYGQYFGSNQPHDPSAQGAGTTITKGSPTDATFESPYDCYILSSYKAVSFDLSYIWIPALLALVIIIIISIIICAQRRCRRPSRSFASSMEAIAECDDREIIGAVSPMEYSPHQPQAGRPGVQGSTGRVTICSL